MGRRGQTGKGFKPTEKTYFSHSWSLVIRNFQLTDLAKSVSVSLRSLRFKYVRRWAEKTQGRGPRGQWFLGFLHLVRITLPGRSQGFLSNSD